MGMNGPEPTAADWANARAQSAEASAERLEKRVAFLEQHLGVKYVEPQRNPIEDAKAYDAWRNDRIING